MALITLRGYLFNELGAGVGDIEVEAFAKNADGTWVGTPAASVTSSSPTGKWEIVNLDTDDAPETGVFGLRLTNPGTGQVRVIEGDTRMMFGQVIGASGGAPLANQSVLAAHILDGAVSDTKLGNRTADDAVVHASLTGTLTQLLGLAYKLIKGITGESSALTAPDITLAATKTLTDSHTTSIATAATHMANTSNPHSTTAAQVGAVANAGTVVKAQSGTHASRPAAATAGNGAVYISTDEQLIAFSNGSAWITIAISDYSDLTGIPASSSTFGTFAVSGQSNVVADSAADTVTLVAGTGITITTNATTDAITITNSAAAGNSFGTIAVSGQSDVVSDAAGDTFTLVAGTGITITTNAAGDSVTITNSLPNTSSFGTVAVSGQTNVVAETDNDTLTLAAGTGITLTTTPASDTVTITNSAAAGNSFGTIAVSGASNVVADQANDTLTIVAGNGLDITTSAAGDSVTFTVDETELTIDNALDSAFSICADLALTNVAQTVDTFASVPAGTYHVFADLGGESAEGENGTFKLVADGVTQTPTGRISSGVGGGWNAHHQWIVTLTSSGDLTLTAQENVSPSTIVVNDTYSSFGYVRIA